MLKGCKETTKIRPDAVLRLVTSQDKYKSGAERMSLPDNVLLVINSDRDYLNAC